MHTTEYVLWQIGSYMSRFRAFPAAVNLIRQRSNINLHIAGFRIVGHHYLLYTLHTSRDVRRYKSISCPIKVDMHSEYEGTNDDCIRCITIHLTINMSD